MTTSQEIMTPPPRIGRLDTIGAVAKEMGRVYRQARRSEIATKDASRLIYMLDRLRTVLDVVGLERRLDELERRAKELKAKTIQRRISKLEIEIGVPITTLYEGMTVEKLLELLKDPHANPEAVSVFQEILRQVSGSSRGLPKDRASGRSPSDNVSGK